MTHIFQAAKPIILSVAIMAGLSLQGLQADTNIAKLKCPDMISLIG